MPVEMEKKFEEIWAYEFGFTELPTLKHKFFQWIRAPRSEGNFSITFILFFSK